MGLSDPQTFAVMETAVAKPKIRIIKGLTKGYRKPPVGTCFGCAHCLEFDDNYFKHYAFCLRTHRWRNNKGCQHYMVAA